MSSKLTIRGVFEKFSERWEQIHSPKTRVKYRYDLDRWERFSGNPTLAKICGAVLMRFRDAAHQAGLADSTIHGTFQGVYAILREAQRRGLISAIPEKPRRRREPPRKGPPPSLEVFDRFVRTGDAMFDRGEIRTRLQNGWFRACMALAYFTAMRRSDLLSLEWDQIIGDTIEFRAQKTGKLHVIPMHPLLQGILADFREIGQRKVIPVGQISIKRACHAVCREIDASSIHIQNIRKLSARQYERAHAGAGALILGHSIPGATAYYLDAPEILRHAVAKLAVPSAFANHVAVNLPIVAASPALRTGTDLFGVVSTSDLR